MDVLITLKSLYDSLPNAELRVAEYILRHSDRVPYESVNEIAKNVNVSVPSVTRLTKRLGFHNFKDFKVALAMGESQSSLVVDVFSQITKDDTDSDIIDKAFLGNIKSLNDTMKIIDRNGIVRFSELCAAASRLVFFGVGSSGIICDEAALRFSHLDLQAEACNDTVSIILQMSRLKKKQICIGISHSGKTALVGEGLRIAKGQGAITALITNYMNTPFKELCDYVFYTSFVENSVKSAAVSSKIAQLAIIDTIYLLTAKKMRRTWDLSEFDITLGRLMRVK